MNRTALLLRRKLLCAVLACPLAAWQLIPALALQGVYSMLAAGLPGALSNRWYSPESPLLPRAAFPLCGAYAFVGLLRRLLSPSFPAPFAPYFRALCVLSGILLQCALILRAQKAGKRHLAACLPLLYIFTVCMR